MGSLAVYGGEQSLKTGATRKIRSEARHRLEEKQ
ncbi:DUF2773 domain-containing protein [Escherichia coli]|nr:DUF2773 domain-containing protein [Escherichia coli]